MKGTIGLWAVSCIALLGAQTACSKSGDNKKEVAEVAQDTMLLHDLAEANRNTAAGEVDTTMAVVQGRGGGSGPGALTSGTVRTPTPAQPGTFEQPAQPAQSGQSAAAPAPQPQRPVARIPAPTRANDASAPTTVPTRSTSDGSSSQASSSGDPCDSPSTTDQRTCLNRAIANNDVELNRVYQDLIRQSRASGGSVLEERYRQSQRDWVTRRDVECRQQNAVSEGRLWARGMARCLADYSDRRVPELRRSLNQLRGQ